MAITKNSQIDLNGNEMILDADGDTTITADTDDQIDIKVGGSDTVHMGLTTYNASDRIVLTNTSGNASMAIVAGTSGESSVFMADGTSGDASYRGYVQYQHTNDNMNFGTAGSEAMRIDSSGNVGTAARLSVGTTTVGGGNTKIVATGGTDNYIQLVSNTGTGGVSLGNAGSVFLLYTHTGALGSESFTERMRIDSSGVVTIGTTASGASSSLRCFSTPTNANVGVARFEATGEAAATTAMSVVKSVNDNSTSNVFVRFGINAYAGGSGQINANGSSQAAFGSFSDRRLKENITDLPSQLDKLKAMRPVEFDYIESEGGGHQLGFIAQEIEEIYPDMVGEREDGMKTLSGLGKWEARLVKAIQEQQEQIEALQSEINTLKGG